MTTPKLYSRGDRYNIVDYDDDGFMRNLYFRDGGFHEDYEMWMARKKHDGTWTAEDEAIEEKRQSKIDKAFFRYQQEQTRELSALLGREFPEWTVLHGNSDQPVRASGSV